MFGGEVDFLAHRWRAGCCQEVPAGWRSIVAEKSTAEVFLTAGLNAQYPLFIGSCVIEASGNPGKGNRKATLHDRLTQERDPPCCQPLRAF